MGDETFQSGCYLLPCGSIWGIRFEVGVKSYPAVVYGRDPFRGGRRVKSYSEVVYGGYISRWV